VESRILSCRRLPDAMQKNGLFSSFCFNIFSFTMQIEVVAS
jgi:hypothetical protein